MPQFEFTEFLPHSCKEILLYKERLPLLVKTSFNLDCVHYFQFVSWVMEFNYDRRFRCSLGARLLWALSIFMWPFSISRPRTLGSQASKNCMGCLPSIPYLRLVMCILSHLFLFSILSASSVSTCICIWDSLSCSRFVTLSSMVDTFSSASVIQFAWVSSLLH